MKPADLHSEGVDKFDREVTVTGTDESSKLALEIPRPLKYERDACENNVVHRDAVKPHRGFRMAGTELFPVKAIQDDSKEANCSNENEMGVQPIQMEQNKEVSEWEKFVCGASDMLNCLSPTKDNYHDELDDRSTDSGMLSFVSTVLQPPNEHNIEPQKVNSVCPVKSENHEEENLMNKPQELEKLNERSQPPAGNPHAVFAEEVVDYLSTEVDNKVDIH